jgi:hypothetical protein
MNRLFAYSIWPFEKPGGFSSARPSSARDFPGARAKGKFSLTREIIPQPGGPGYGRQPRPHSEKKSREKPVVQPTPASQASSQFLMAEAHKREREKAEPVRCPDGRGDFSGRCLVAAALAISYQAGSREHYHCLPAGELRMSNYDKLTRGPLTEEESGPRTCGVMGRF